MPDTLPRDQRADDEDEPRGYDPETHAPQEDAWDRQIEADAKAGRLDELADRARAQYWAGHATDLEGNPVDPSEDDAPGEE